MKGHSLGALLLQGPTLHSQWLCSACLLWSSCGDILRASAQPGQQRALDWVLGVLGSCPAEPRFPCVSRKEVVPGGLSPFQLCLSAFLFSQRLQVCSLSKAL